MTSPCRLLLFSLVVLTGTVHGWWFRKPKTVPTVSTASKVSGETIARIADDYVNSTKWAKSAFYSIKYWGRNKCNMFVADVVKEAGGNVPQRKSDEWSPIGAGEWGNPRSSYLTNDTCWSQVFTPRRGDVIGDGVHVGIVTGSRLTTSAAKSKVVKNDWGFRSSNRGIIYWRYNC